MDKKFWIAYISFVFIYVTAMIIFTPYDYTITSSLFSPSIWLNEIFEVIGPIFMPFFTIYAVVSLIMNLKFQNKTKRVFSYIGFGLLYIYAFFMGCMSLKYSYASYLFIPSIILYILFTVLMVYLNKKVFVNYKDKHIRICFVILIVVLTSLALTDIIKLAISRVRFQEISNLTPYNPWYVPTGRFVLNSSFPSGHVTRAGTTLCFALLLLYKGAKKRCVVLIEICALVFTILVGISRLFEGKHFMCDILTALFLIVSSYYLGKHFVLKN